MYYTELDPFTSQAIFVEKNDKQKERQKEIVTGTISVRKGTNFTHKGQKGLRKGSRRFQ
jgi:hypothetical protein